MKKWKDFSKKQRENFCKQRNFKYEFYWNEMSDREKIMVNEHNKDFEMLKEK